MNRAVVNTKNLTIRCLLSGPSELINVDLEADEVLIPTGIDSIDEMAAVMADDGGIMLIKTPPRPLLHVWVNGQWEPPPVDIEQESANVRERRGALLSASDWTQLPDVPEATRLKWQAYRQALRDITKQPGYPTDVVWPEQPR